MSNKWQWLPEIPEECIPVNCGYVHKYPDGVTHRRTKIGMTYYACGDVYWTDIHGDLIENVYAWHHIGDDAPPLKPPEQRPEDQTHALKKGSKLILYASYCAGTNNDKCTEESPCDLCLQESNRFELSEDTVVKSIDTPRAETAEALVNTWKTELPPKQGYYEADFGDGPVRVWLTPVHASDYHEDSMVRDGIVWGWDKTDDPELVEAGCESGHQFRWREESNTVEAVQE